MPESNAQDESGRSARNGPAEGGDAYEKDARLEGRKGDEERGDAGGVTEESLDAELSDRIMQLAMEFKTRGDELVSEREASALRQARFKTRGLRLETSSFQNEMPPP